MQGIERRRRGAQRIHRGYAAFIMLACLTCLTANAIAEEKPRMDATELAKQTQDPTANLISLPFQNNTSFTLGREDQVQNVLNVQPIIPFSMGKDWRLLTRTILPLTYQPDIVKGSGGSFGLGDTTFTAWVAPTFLGHWTFGVGPVLYFPTATVDLIRTNQWGIGPSAVVAYKKDRWVVGGMMNHVFRFAGPSSDLDPNQTFIDNERPSLNQMTLQAFLNYNLGKGWYLVSAPLITANWKASPNDRWLVPIGGGAGKVFALGAQKMNASLQAYYNVVSPDNTQGPEWTIRFVMQFLFPKG